MTCVPTWPSELRCRLLVGKVGGLEISSNRSVFWGNSIISEVLDTGSGRDRSTARMCFSFQMLCFEAKHTKEIKLVGYLCMSELRDIYVSPSVFAIFNLQASSRCSEDNCFDNQGFSHMFMLVPCSLVLVVWILGERAHCI